MTPEITYAVGDLHGRYDLFEAGLKGITTHASGRHHRIIYLGDYVDRGPQSRELVQALIDLQAIPIPGREVICLKGNHEQFLILGCRYGALIDSWLYHGGAETLKSYGHPGKITFDQNGDLSADVEIDLNYIPKSHLEWCEALPLTFEEADRFFVHAGVDPWTPTALQKTDEDTLLWTREKFLRVQPRAGQEAPFDRHIVHGHTPFWACKPDKAKPELLPYRTNLDTGAVWTGVSIIGVFNPAKPGGPVSLISVQGEAW